MKTFIKKGIKPIDKPISGHRERLRQRFLTGDEGSHDDEALLELLLTYAIPQKDVQPLAKQLIAKFGSLQNVLAADVDTLCKFDGLKTHSTALLKLTDWIRLHCSPEAPSLLEKSHKQTPQSTLFESIEIKKVKEPAVKAAKKVKPRRGTGLFGKAVLKEAIALVPKIPDLKALEEVRDFLRKNLHYSAQQTRRRYADYIANRMFLHGYPDKALSLFAVKYAGRQELKDVCLYRFCIAEPLMFDVIENLFLPSIGAGRLKRERLREYLQQRFPSSKSIGDSAKAIVDALTAGGVASADHATINFSYRDILLPSFAFILHSEFPESGMYDIAKLQSNRAIHSMLWNPARIMPSLYELRNQGLISKISEIDNIRQFTTRWTPDEVVTKLLDEKGRS
jgi:DNA repair protein RadC